MEMDGQLRGRAPLGVAGASSVGLVVVWLGLVVSPSVAWLGLVISASVAWSGPLGDDLGVADPVRALAPRQREAARALGEARGHVDAHRLDAARAALARAEAASELAGYVDLVRIRLLMKQGDHREAHAVATQALDVSKSDALRAALGVLQGEALALAGDARGAELAWSNVLGETGAEDESVRQSIQLSIVASRQRTGSLDPTEDPLVLLDRHYQDIAVTAEEVPIAVLPASVVLERASAALEAGHPEQAVAYFDQAIAQELSPEQRRVAAMGRARALFRERRYESAAKAFGALLPDVEARFWQARSLARSGQVDRSLEAFGEVASGEDEELASWALYLAGTLYEDRGEMDAAIEAFGRAAESERFPHRARKALWRKGWARYRTGAYGSARKAFLALAKKTEEPLDTPRPRFWAARAAFEAGQTRAALRELESLARDFPLTYYGWRAKERLPEGQALVRSERELREGTRRVEDEVIERVALLIEAGLEDLARDELRFAAPKARGFVDRTRVGALLARVGDYHRANRLVVTAYGDSLARGLQDGREALWWLSWPPAYRETIEAALPEEAAIEPELVWAIMREESHYRVDARSSVGALGLLQLMPATARQLAEERGLEGFETEDLFDPRTNITLGSAYLDQLADRFDGRLSAAIGSYNAGPRRVSSWLQGEARKLPDDVWVEDIPYDQTRAYVKRVLRSLHVYKSFYR